MVHAHVSWWRPNCLADDAVSCELVSAPNSLANREINREFQGCSPPASAVERLQMQREMLQSGRFRIHENDESGQRDISDQNIARLTDNISELDGLIAEYEAKRG